MYSEHCKVCEVLKTADIRSNCVGLQYRFSVVRTPSNVHCIDSNFYMYTFIYNVHVLHMSI